MPKYHKANRRRRRLPDPTGKVFGKLTALYEESERSRYWVCKCECGNIHSVLIDSLRKGFSTSCGCARLAAVRHRPYEGIYRLLLRCAKESGKECSLTFEEFLSFIPTKACHYCGVSIAWDMYTSQSKYRSSAYFLDRKDNSRGYHKDNCVVCCSLCNRRKGSSFTYEEFLVIGRAIASMRDTPKEETNKAPSQ